MAVPARVSVVTLGVRDFERMRGFYRALGWEESPNATDSWTAFTTAGARLALYPLADLAGEAGLPPRERPHGEFGGITLAVNVERAEQVDETFEAMVAAGASALARPQQRDWGGRSAYIADPEGNVWEIAWAPDAAFDERGALAAL